MRNLNGSSFFNCTENIWIIIYIIIAIESSIGLIGCTPKNTKVSKNILVAVDETTSSTEKWLFVGDSLTAGYGVAPNESYVAQLQSRLKEMGLQISLRNAGVSGDTSAGVLRRLDWLLNDTYTYVFVCIGANDGLRGQPVRQLQDNLTSMIKRIKEHGATPVLLGMKLPINYGLPYRKQFEDSYAEVAREENISFLPFLLEGAATKSSLNLPDGIHPNAKGYTVITDRVLEFIKNEGFLTKEKE